MRKKLKERDVELQQLKNGRNTLLSSLSDAVHYQTSLHRHGANPRCAAATHKHTNTTDYPTHAPVDHWSSMDLLKIWCVQEQIVSWCCILNQQ